MVRLIDLLASGLMGCRSGKGRVSHCSGTLPTHY